MLNSTHTLLSTIYCANVRGIDKIIINYKIVFIPILQILVEFGFISHYMHLGGKLFIIFKFSLLARGDKGAIQKINFFRRGLRFSNSSCLSLAKLQLKQSNIICSIISTDRGVVPSHLAIRGGIGGKPIARLL